MNRPRLLLADDHTLMLDGIRMLLEPEFELVGCVEDGQMLLTAALESKPDVILLDISMPVLNGIDAAHQLRKTLPSAKIIFVTMHADADFVTEAFRAGAAGYLLKRSAASELLTAIREVLKGNHYVSPLVTRNALDLFIATSKPGGKLGDRLTARQREVLQLVAEGRSRKEIGAALNISVKTVEFHKASLMRELNLKTVADFTMYAIEHGMIASERSS
jgi:DNA-binding NarL/FixJ family response regulator